MTSIPNKQITIVGSGWSAITTTLLALQRGVRVRLIRTFYDVDCLPRPFPPLSHPAWLEFVTNHDLRGEWLSFLGRVNNPFKEQKITTTNHGHTIKVSQGHFIIQPSDPVWAWTEPLNYSQLFDKLLNIVRNSKNLEIIDLSSSRSTLKFRFGQYWLHGERLADQIVHILPEGWRWFPVTDYWHPVCPRSALQEGVSWWGTNQPGVVYLSQPEVPLDLATRIHINNGATLKSSRQWGMVPGRNIRHLNIASPAIQSASRWFTSIRQTLNKIL